MGVFQLMLIISLSAASRAHNCSDSWYVIEGDCWRFFAFEKGINQTWNNAKLGCERRGAILGYPRTNTAFKHIMSEAYRTHANKNWTWLHMGLHLSTGINSTIDIEDQDNFVVLENGKEPNDKIPWMHQNRPTNIDGYDCALLRIRVLQPRYQWSVGRIDNFACDLRWYATGYACKKEFTAATTAAPPRPTTSTQGATRSQESSTSGSVPRITDTTTTVAESSYVLTLAVVGGLIGAIVTTGMCCGSTILLHFFPDKDQADVASLDSKGERDTDDKSSGSDDSNTSGSDD